MTLTQGVVFDAPTSGAASDVRALGRALSPDGGATGPAQPLTFLDDSEWLNELTWYLEDSWQWPYAGFATRAAKVEASLAEIGKRLLNYISPLLDVADGGTVIIESHVGVATALPWELMHDGQTFLALRDPPVRIIRRGPFRARGNTRRRNDGPLRILLVTARPEDAGAVDQRIIATELLNELKPAIAAGQIVLEFLRPPTFAALVARLGGDPAVDVLHFDGHGLADPSFGAVLLFEADNQRSDLVSAGQLGNALNEGGVSYAVLTACQSAVQLDADPLSSLAGELIRQEAIAGVVAMGASVLTISAARYARHFYRGIASAQPASEAHAQAVLALASKPERQLHRVSPRTLGVRVKLQDWWLPRLFLEHDRTLVRGAGSTVGTGEMTPRAKSGVTPPSYGFVGRSREALRVERKLWRGQIVVLHGLLGSGKTALAAATADWLVRTDMYERIVWVPPQGASLSERLVRELARALGIGEAGWETIFDRLRTGRYLVIIDGIDARAAEALMKDTATQEVLLQMAAQPGCGVLVTSRAPLRWGPSDAAERFAIVDVGSLSPPDTSAITLAIMQAIGIDGDEMSRGELLLLLEELDGHPAAIEAIVPLLAKISPAELFDGYMFSGLRAGSDIDGVLGKMLDAVIHPLDPLIQSQLVPLVSLRSGGFESNLLLVTGFKSAEWEALFPTLQALGLAQHGPSVDGDRFIWVHPLLRSYIYSQLTDIEPLSRAAVGHAELYFRVAQILYFQGLSDASVRRTMALEIRNLCSAVDTLLIFHHEEAAQELFGMVSTFLTDLGMTAKRDAIRRRIDTEGLEKHNGGAMTETEHNNVSARIDELVTAGDLVVAEREIRSVLARLQIPTPPRQTGPGARGWVQTLDQLGRVLTMRGVPREAVEALREAQRLLDVNDSPGTSADRDHALLQHDLGVALRGVPELAQSRAALESARDAFRSQGDAVAEASALVQLGWTLLELGDHDAASESLIRGQMLFRRVKDPLGEAAADGQLGLLELARDHLDEAEMWTRESLRISERIENPDGTARACLNLAKVALRRERPDEAGAWAERGLSAGPLPAELLRELEDVKRSAGSAGTDVGE